MTAFATEDKDMTAERISPNDLLHLGRQAVKPGAQIDRLTARKTFVPGARPIIPVLAPPTAPAAAPAR